MNMNILEEYKIKNHTRLNGEGDWREGGGGCKIQVLSSYIVSKFNREVIRLMFFNQDL